MEKRIQERDQRLTEERANFETQKGEWRVLKDKLETDLQMMSNNRNADGFDDQISKDDRATISTEVGGAVDVWTNFFEGQGRPRIPPGFALGEPIDGVCRRRREKVTWKDPLQDGREQSQQVPLFDGVADDRKGQRSFGRQSNVANFVEISQSNRRRPERGMTRIV